MKNLQFFLYRISQSIVFSSQIINKPKVESFKLVDHFKNDLSLISIFDKSKEIKSNNEFFINRWNFSDNLFYDLKIITIPQETRYVSTSNQMIYRVLDGSVNEIYRYNRNHTTLNKCSFIENQSCIIISNNEKTHPSTIISMEFINKT